MKSIDARVFLLCLAFLVSCDNNGKSDELATDFQIIVSDLTAGNNGAIMKVNPTTGTLSVITEGGRFQTGPADVVVDKDGMIYTPVNDVPGSPPEIVRVDPDSGSQVTISAGGYLKTTIDGIAVENDEYLLVTKGEVNGDRIPRLLRVHKITGDQTILSQGGLLHNVYDVVVSDDGDIFVLGQGIQTNNNVNYVVPAVFRIDPLTGDPAELFKIMDGYFYEIALEPDGSILIAGSAVLRIDPGSGEYEELVSTIENLTFKGITVSDQGEIFVAQKTSYSCTLGRVVADSGIVRVISYSGQLDYPSGMDLMYLK